jgi:hypothetical protein
MDCLSSPRRWAPARILSRVVGPDVLVVLLDEYVYKVLVDIRYISLQMVKGT